MAEALMTLIQASFLQQEYVDAGAKDLTQMSVVCHQDAFLLSTIETLLLMASFFVGWVVFGGIRKLDPRRTPSESLEKRTTFQPRAAMGPAEPVAVKPKACEAPMPAVPAGPTTEKRLVVAVAKLSDMEQALGQAQQMKPAEDGEAQNWHQVSLTALKWTRNAQSQQDHVLLKGFKSVVLAAQPAVAERKVDTTSGRACAWPPGVLHTAANSIESSAGETEAKVHSDGSFAEVTEDKEIPVGGSSRSDLERIRDRDPGCCLIVRPIERLGMESPELQREHFGRLSEVDDVCVANSFEKPNANRVKLRNGRIRPSAIGFSVMATKEGAQKVIAEGNDQIVGQAASM